MTDWRVHALCADKDPELWFPQSAAEAESAKVICGMCPVRVDCLAYGRSVPGVFGVWGGVWLG